MRPITLEFLKTLEPIPFQRLAVDLLHAEAVGTALVRTGERAYGRNDGGWDGELEGEFRLPQRAPSVPTVVLQGRVRVEVKRTKNASSTLEDLNEYQKRYPDGPLLLITAADLSVEERAALERLGAGRPIGVVTGGEVAQWARACPRSGGAGAWASKSTASWRRSSMKSSVPSPS